MNKKGLRKLSLAIEGRENATELTWQYLASLIEHRAYVGEFYVAVRLKNPRLPRLLQEVFGGTFFWNRQGAARRAVFKVQGAAAMELLETVSSHLVTEGPRIALVLARWNASK